MIHVVLICAGKIVIDTIPGMSQQISWTLVNLCYLTVCRLFFDENRAKCIAIALVSYVPLGHRHTVSK